MEKYLILEVETISIIESRGNLYYGNIWGMEKSLSGYVERKGGISTIENRDSSIVESYEKWRNLYLDACIEKEKSLVLKVEKISIMVTIEEWRNL